MRLYASQIGALLVFAQAMACSGQGSSGDPNKVKDLVNNQDALPDHPNIHRNYSTIQPSPSPVDPSGNCALEQRFCTGRPTPTLEPSPDPSPIQVDIPKNEPGKPQVSADFNKFCTGAQTAKIFTASAGLKSLLGELCDGDAVKPLLAATLLRNVYPGSGNMKLSVLRALSTDLSTQITSIRYAYVVKLPITAEDYFDFVLPKVLTVASIQGSLQGSGGTASVDEQQRFVKDGPTHVRGVLVTQVLRKDSAAGTTVLGSETRYDHHKSEDGFSYFMTSIVVRPLASIGNNDVLSLIVRLGNASYLIALVDTSVGSQASTSIWEQALTRWVLEDSNDHYKRIIDDSKP